FIAGVLEDGGKRFVGHLSAAEPMKLLAHGIVEPAITRDGRRLNVNNSQAGPWGGYETVRRGQHFQIVDRDLDQLHGFTSLNSGEAPRMCMPDPTGSQGGLWPLADFILWADAESFRLGGSRTSVRCSMNGPTFFGRCRR